ncbi:MAG TPA: hypothetical protein VG963_31295 [Polyangiaceae bacterium]|nr:hypothetical protein [Polyangiaceae bacterium]
MKRAPWLATLVLLGCADREATKPALNRCAQDFECGEPYRCDAKLGICYQLEATRPFPLALEITPDANGGAGLVARWTVETGTATGIPTNGRISIPRAVLVTGNVNGTRLDGRMGTIEAEVAFVPVPATAKPYLTHNISVLTQPQMDESGQTINSFSARLEPDTDYEVLVFPLGPESVAFPPGMFALRTGTTDRPNVPFDYGAQDLVLFNATMADENDNPVPSGFKLRLQDKKTGQVVSSLGTTGKRLTSAEDGSAKEVDAIGAFSLRAPRSVLDTLSSHELVLGLETVLAPWLVAIAFDGAGLRQDAKITMPELPTAVPLRGSVEVNGSGTKVSGDVTFLSTFPLPITTGDVRGVDWCRLREPGSPQNTFHCSASVTTSVGSDGQLSTSLLPGDYHVFVTPTSGIDPFRRVATTSQEFQIETQYDGGFQGPYTFGVAGAASYRGHVVSPRGNAMPLVAVTANALGIRYDLDEVARHNRTAEAVSDAHGAVELTVDEGYYDLIAVPPEGSGFAQCLLYNRRIGKAGEFPPSGAIEPQLPVLARGSLQTEDGRPVSNAHVDAFAIVPSLEPEGARAVRVAQATSDDAGTFTLLLPPYIGVSPREADAGDAGFDDGAVDLDIDAAGLDLGVPSDAGTPRSFALGDASVGD